MSSVSLRRFELSLRLGPPFLQLADAGSILVERSFCTTQRDSEASEEEGESSYWQANENGVSVLPMNVYAGFARFRRSDRDGFDSLTRSAFVAQLLTQESREK